MLHYQLSRLPTCTLTYQVKQPTQYALGMYISCTIDTEVVGG